MKRLPIFAAASTVLLGFTPMLLAQNAPVAQDRTYVLQFHLSDKANPEVTIHENDKFNLSLDSNGVKWKLQGTSAKAEGGLRLAVTIASKQEGNGSSASGNASSTMTIKADGQPVKLGSVSTSLNGTTQSAEITATLKQKD